MKHTNTPYTYIIGWSKLNQWYYGVRYSKSCHPNDLWQTYFTSSKVVHKFKELHGEPDFIKIHKTFANKKHARYFEYRVINFLKLDERSNWLNLCGSSYGFKDTKPPIGPANPMYGKKHSQETRKLLSEKRKLHSGPNKGKPMPESRKTASRKTKEINNTLPIGDKNGMFNKKHSESSKVKMSIAKRTQHHYHFFKDDVEKYCTIDDLMQFDPTIKRNGIWYVLGGYQKTHRGWSISRLHQT